MILSKITGVGSYLPEKVLTNSDLEKTLNTSDEWIQTRTGIKKRHIAGKTQKTSDLATIAVNNALKSANLSSNNLDALILATTTPDLIFPSTAVKVQSNINMNTGFAFDVQAACSGFLYALQIADSLIKSRQVRKVAIVGAETMSKIVDWNDRSTCILFGDGAGSIILEKVEDTKNCGVIDVKLFSDGSFQNILAVNGGVSHGNLSEKITMNGREVFKHAVTKMTQSIQSIVRKNGFSSKNLDWVLLHQANIRIIKAVMNKLGLDMKASVSTVMDHANTSAASIPLALDQYILEGKIKTGDLMAFAAVGSGLTWGAALLKI